MASIGKIIVGLVTAGAITQQRLVASVRRVLREKFVLGLFDDPFVNEDAAATIARAQEFREAGLVAQHASVTLLKNAPTADGTPTLALREGSTPSR